MEPKKERTDVRTTVSLAQVVWDIAEQQMDAKGYNNNFSAYVAELIRRDRERDEEKRIALARSQKFPQSEERMLLEDKPAPARPKESEGVSSDTSKAILGIVKKHYFLSRKKTPPTK